MAYDELEPIGIERIEYCIAMLCANIVNAIRVIHAAIFNNRNIKMMNSPLDFMPIWDIEEAKRFHASKKQSIKEMKQILLAIGGKKKKK